MRGSVSQWGPQWARSPWHPEPPELKNKRVLFRPPSLMFRYVNSSGQTQTSRWKAEVISSRLGGHVSAPGPWVCGGGALTARARALWRFRTASGPTTSSSLGLQQHLLLLLSPPILYGTRLFPQ